MVSQGERGVCVGRDRSRSSCCGRCGIGARRLGLGLGGSLVVVRAFRSRSSRHCRGRGRGVFAGEWRERLRVRVAGGRRWVGCVDEVPSKGRLMEVVGGVGWLVGLLCVLMRIVFVVSFVVGFQVAEDLVGRVVVGTVRVSMFVVSREILVLVLVVRTPGNHRPQVPVLVLVFVLCLVRVGRRVVWHGWRE